LNMLECQSRSCPVSTVIRLVFPFSRPSITSSACLHSSSWSFQYAIPETEHPLGALLVDRIASSNRG
jgi:hypothetical protein